MDGLLEGEGKEGPLEDSRCLGGLDEADSGRNEFMRCWRCDGVGVLEVEVEVLECVLRLEHQYLKY